MNKDDRKNNTLTTKGRRTLPSSLYSKCVILLWPLSKKQHAPQFILFMAVLLLYLETAPRVIRARGTFQNCKEERRECDAQGTLGSRDHDEADLEFQFNDRNRHRASSR